MQDSMLRSAINDVVRKDPSLAPYEDEIGKVIFNTPPEVRATYDVGRAANDAAALVGWQHKDDIINAEREIVRKEAGLNRRVDGESLSTTSKVTLEDGSIAELNKDEQELLSQVEQVKRQVVFCCVHEANL